MMFNPRPKGLGRDNFVKLRDGEEIAGVFKGAPHTFRKHWSQNRSVECIGAECPICKADPENRASFRFRINLVTTVNGKYLSKIFEGGGATYDELTALDKKFNLSMTPIEITRRGAGQQTKYSIIPLAHTPVTPEIAKEIERVELLPLTAEAEE